MKKEGTQFIDEKFEGEAGSPRMGLGSASPV
jgi:hypothetical protein